MVIDAHHHLWQYQSEKHHWIDETMTKIRKDFTGEDLSAVLSQNGIVGTVLVQVDQSEAETRWLIEQSEKFPFILGVIGWVDFMSENIRERLVYFDSFPIVKGFRHIVQAESEDFLMGKPFLNGLGHLQEFDFTYDFLIYPSQLKAAVKLVETLPNQSFVLDHIAKPMIRDGMIQTWANDIKLLSQFPNVFCKVSGIITEAHHQKWNFEQLRPYLDVVFECFGINRLMFGSDWPVCLLAGQYEQVLQVVQDYLSGFSSEQIKQVMYDNARNFYDL